ncbi:MAG: hypothetical protein H6867_11695 [Rhodospirillales bacterium]|nr:hypothetical protein [Rhodospirillales bacterium]
MPVFNKRDRDNKGAGKVRLEESNNDNQDGGLNKKYILLGGGALVAAGLATAIILSGDDEDTMPEPPVRPPVVVTVPSTPAPPAPPVVTPQPQVPEITKPAITVQHFVERAREKISTIRNKDECLYEAFVTAANKEVREGMDFSHFTCLYDEGGIGVLLTEGQWAGTRVSFLPRDGAGGAVIVEKVGAAQLGADGRTTEYHRLSYDDRTSTSISMSKNDQRSDGVRIPENADRFSKRVYRGTSTTKAFTIAGNPQQGVFEVEIPNGDVYQINLNTGDFYADSLFLNCPTYRYGAEQDCPRNDFQPVKGIVPGLD